MLTATFMLTVFRSLTEGIVTGVALGMLLFINRMSQATAVREDRLPIGADLPDSVDPRPPYGDEASDPEIVVYRITGPLFFGASATIGTVLDRISDRHKALVVDLSAVPFLDATGANMIDGLARKAEKRGVALWLTGARGDVLRALLAHGLRRPGIHFAASIDLALERIRQRH